MEVQGCLRGSRQGRLTSNTEVEIYKKFRSSLRKLETHAESNPKIVEIQFVKARTFSHTVSNALDDH
jgi:hypothetical protein